MENIKKNLKEKIIKNTWPIKEEILKLLRTDFDTVWNTPFNNLSSIHKEYLKDYIQDSNKTLFEEVYNLLQENNIMIRQVTLNNTFVGFALYKEKGLIQRSIRHQLEEVNLFLFRKLTEEELEKVLYNFILNSTFCYSISLNVYEETLKKTIKNFCEKYSFPFNKNVYMIYRDDILNERKK